MNQKNEIEKRDLLPLTEEDLNSYYGGTMGVCTCAKESESNCCMHDCFGTKLWTAWS